ncbi:hypothetical protein [Aquifex sp.]
MRKKFLAETIRNFGVGLMVGAFLLRITEQISDLTLILILLEGLSNVLFALTLIPEEE